MRSTTRPGRIRRPRCKTPSSPSWTTAPAVVRPPDLHVDHYELYETTVLKRLAMRYQTREKEHAGLLCSEVFVDLFAAVLAPR